MKSGFHDPVAIKKQSPKNSPVDGKNSPWDYASPQYDQRSSCFVNVGTHYGDGHKQPVGHSDGAKMHVPCLPFGKITTMRLDEAG